MGFSCFSKSNQMFDTIDRMILNSNVSMDSSGDCQNILEDYYGQLRAAQPDLLNSKLSKDELKSYIKKTFGLKLKINERISELDYSNTYYKECLQKIKVMTQSLGYLEDYLIAKYYEDFDKKKLNHFEFRFPYFLSSPKYHEFKGVNSLETGDIILTRAKTFGSAAIARIGKKDTHFSHLGIVYKNEKGELYTVESLIEHGLIVAPIKKHLKRKHFRTLVFRNKDRALGKKAARLIYEHALKRTKKGRVDYDFTMDYKNHGNYFCSEVIHHAYKLATNGKMQVPFFKTKINAGIVPFLNHIGVPVTKEDADSFDLFAPSDMQFDHRFEIVAEWRNPKQVFDIRFKDAILSNMFYWMERENYELRINGGHKFTSMLALGVRNTPLLGLTVKNLYPKNMKPRAIQAFLALDGVAKKLEKKVRKKEKDLGRLLDYTELYEYLEKVKNDDYKLWKAGKKSLFHKTFHP